MRKFWTSGRVRAVDLVDGDVAIIGDVWREVMDVWTSRDDPAAQFGDDDPLTQEIHRFTKWGDGSLYVAVRYLHEVDSTQESQLVYRVCPVRACALVTVQVPEVERA